MQWLNPGHKDKDKDLQADLHGLVPFLLWRSATICIRNGRKRPRGRVEELRDLIWRWAARRHLIRENEG